MVTLFQKPSPGIIEDVCRTLAPSTQCIRIRRVATYIEERWASSDVWSRRVHLDTHRTSRERVRVARIQVLPIVPNLIDHLRSVSVSLCLNETVSRTYRVMEEEQWVYMKGTLSARIHPLDHAHHLETTSVQARSSWGVATQTDTLPPYPLQG